jgi:ATP-binding cassette subfamily B protein
MREAFRSIRGSTSRMNATTGEQVSGMTVIQAFGRQAAAAREFDEVNSDYRNANNSAIKWDAIQDAAIDTISAICMASIVLSLGYEAVSFGTLVAFAAYIKEFFDPISALAQRYTLLQSAMAGAERVFGLLDVREKDAPVRKETAAADVSGDVAVGFEHVTFSYKEDTQVLGDVSFTVKRGEKIALVGPTGAGKTTVTALLLRLYDASEGVVRVNGRDVRGLERGELRRQFAVVPQDVFLFPGSVLQNLALGSEAPDRARAEEALRRIGALDLFTRREGGLDALVEERGDNFSAGERQLIAFARAMYKDTPLLILDEATASIDSDTEARLSAALEVVMQGRTALVIAHRLSTIRAVDRIVVFHRGKVVEAGSHEELLAKGGVYARLYRLQYAQEALAQKGPSPEGPVASPPGSNAPLRG